MQVTVDVSEMDILKLVKDAIGTAFGSNSNAFYSFREKTEKLIAGEIKSEIWDRCLKTVNEILTASREEIIRTAVEQFKEELPKLVAQGMGSLLRDTLTKTLHGAG
jgi:hypothetical protein